MSASSLAFDDSDRHIPVQNFTIYNEGKTSVIYTLGHSGAGTAFTFVNDTTIFPTKFPEELIIVAKYATLAFSGDTAITIPASKRRIIPVSATPPTEVNNRLFPVYSGYITVNGSDGSALSLPYICVGGSLQSLTVLDPANTFLSRSLDRKFARLLSNASFVLPPGWDRWIVPCTIYARYSIVVIPPRVSCVPASTCHSPPGRAAHPRRQQWQLGRPPPPILAAALGEIDGRRPGGNGFSCRPRPVARLSQSLMAENVIIPLVPTANGPYKDTSSPKSDHVGRIEWAA